MVEKFKNQPGETIREFNQLNMQCKKKSVRIHLWVMVIGIIVWGIQGLLGYPGDVFPVPENLKDNVAFWKKIYTEVSLGEGLLHDRDYPMIIYKKLSIGNRQGRARSRYIRYHMGLIQETLKNMNKKPRDEWNVEEQAIGELFQGHADLGELNNAHERVRFQLGQKERYREGLERSGAYIGHIRQVFRQYKIPQRIVFLPHVESSFNPQAYSRVGAAGMWQFMRRTAGIFMRIDYRIDERWDPVKSTEAAAKLLVKNYHEVKSWPLAITAYNHGLGSMVKAVKVTGSRDIGVIIEKYKNRRFKFASKNFYGCFLAASEIAADPEKYFPGIVFHEPYRYNEIELDRSIRPRALAANLGITQEELQRFNPAIRTIVFRHQLAIPRGYRLRVPLSISLATAKQQLGSVIESEKENKKFPVSTDQQYYSVTRGDTLYGIARRFGVTTNDLIIENEIAREDRLYIGQVLRIPGTGKGEPSDETMVIATLTPAPSTSTATTPTDPNSTTTTSIETGSGSQEVKTAPVTAAPSPPPSAGNTGAETTGIENHTGEVALEKPTVKLLNRGFDATIYNLEISLLERKHAGVVTASLNETMGHYADWLGVPVSHIRRLNGNKRHIQVKQKVRIPLKPGVLERFKKTRLEYHMAQEEDFYSRYQVIDVKYRAIKSGDTLWSICQDEEIPIWLFKKYNRDIDIERITLDTPLVIPVLETKENNK